MHNISIQILHTNHVAVQCRETQHIICNDSLLFSSIIQDFKGTLKQNRYMKLASSVNAKNGAKFSISTKYTVF